MEQLRIYQKRLTHINGTSLTLNPNPKQTPNPMSLSKLGECVDCEPGVSWIDYGRPRQLRVSAELEENFICQFVCSIKIYLFSAIPRPLIDELTLDTRGVHQTQSPLLLYKEITGPKISPFSHPYGKNVPFSKLIKTIRPIFIYFKTDGDKIFRQSRFYRLM